MISELLTVFSNSKCLQNYEIEFFFFFINTVLVFFFLTKHFFFFKESFSGQFDTLKYTK